VSNWVDLNALLKILIGGLICGAGLPALFAIGLRALHFGGPTAQPAGAGDAAGDRLTGGNPVGIGIAVVCFAVVVAAVAWGIYWIVNS
jgi:hypothetical protein